MNTRALRRTLVVAAVLIAPTASALGADVAFVFTLNWQGGPLAGSTSHGTLAFDASLVAPDAQYLGTSSLAWLDLSVGDRSYGAADVTTGVLSFDANADVRLLMVGTDCGPGFCLAGDDPASFFMVCDAQSQLDRLTAAARPPDASQFIGTGEFGPAPVPEPSSLMLLRSGLGVLAWRRGATRTTP